MRAKILSEADELLAKCSGFGANPYSVNVITYSGHGITFDGDAIAVIPEIQPEALNLVPRFINMSGLARKFASIENTINIFLLSMCRVSPQNSYLEELEKQNKNKGEGEEEEKQEIKPTYMYLKEDVMSKEAKHDGFH